VIQRSPSHPALVARRAVSIGSVLLAAVIAPSALAAQTAPAVPSTLSVEEAVRIARENNPTFLARQGDLAVARWRVRSATADFVPSVNASTALGYTQPGEQRFGSVGFGDRPSYYSSSYGVGVSLEVNGSKLLQPTVARASERATQQRIEGEEATLVSNVVRQYLSIRQAQEAVAQAEREVARTGEYVRLAQARLDVGAGTPLDVRRAEVQKGQADISLVQAQNTHGQLAPRARPAASAPRSPATCAASDFAVFEPGWRTDDLTALALRNNPTLLAARASATPRAPRCARRSRHTCRRCGLEVGVSGNATAPAASRG
jgi:outer membrane protein